MEEKKIIPENYPLEAVEQVRLRDGTEVTIRPIRPDDAPRLQAGFKSLSHESIYMRFLRTFTELSDKEAREFATVDYQRRMAFVAETGDPDRPRLIGVARYGTVEGEPPNVAESAIIVGDEYQSRGLGTLLMKSLVEYALTQNVNVFLATAHVSNSRIMNFIRRSGRAFEKRILEPGVWEVRIHLDRAE